MPLARAYGWPASAFKGNSIRILKMDIALDNDSKSDHGFPWTVLALVLVAIAAVALWLWQPADRAEASIAWSEVRQGDIELNSPGIGRFISTRQRVITSRESGIVEAIAFQVGEPVEAGDVIVRTASPRLEDEIGSARIETTRERIQSLERLDQARLNFSRAEIELASAKIALETARSEFRMNTELADQDVVSKLEHERSRGRVREAEKRLEGAQLELDAAREHLERQQRLHQETVRLGEMRIQQLLERREALAIRAPQAGVLKRLDIKVGDTLDAGRVIAEIGPGEPDGARLRFPQRTLDRLLPGVPVTLRFLDQTVAGRVVRILPNLVDGMLVAEVRADSLPPSARIDMAVRGDAHLGELEQVVHSQLPVSPDAEGELELQLEREGTLQQVRLSGVQRFGDYLVFTSGVRPGDRIAPAR